MVENKVDFNQYIPSMRNVTAWQKMAICRDIAIPKWC